MWEISRELRWIKKKAESANMRKLRLWICRGFIPCLRIRREEIVTRDFLIKERPDGIINIVDATNIERNLYLTLQLLDLNIPMILALNMMDVVTSNGGKIDVEGIENRLGIPIIPISASRNQGVDDLISRAGKDGT